MTVRSKTHPSAIFDRTPTIESRIDAPRMTLPSQRMERATFEAMIFEPGRKRAWVKIGRSSS